MVEPDGTAQVAVFVDFENLVIGATTELPDQANPAPYEALTRLCRGYGNAERTRTGRIRCSAPIRTTWR